MKLSMFLTSLVLATACIGCAPRHRMQHNTMPVQQVVGANGVLSATVANHAQSGAGVTFPGPFRMETSNENDRERTTYIANDGFAEYRFAVTTSPFDLDAHLVIEEELKPDSNTEQNSIVDRRQAVTSGAFPGVAASIMDSQRNLTRRVRFFVGRRHTYFIEATTTVANQTSLDARMNQFLSSLRLPQNDEPQLQGDGRVANTAGQWSWWYPSGSWFAIETPARMQLSREEVIVEGIPCEQRSFNVMAADGSLNGAVRVTRFYPRTPPDDSLTMISNNVVTSGYRVVEEKRIYSHGHPGREVLFENSTTHARVLARMYVTQVRTFIATASYAQNANDTTRAAAERFVRSIVVY